MCLDDSSYILASSWHLKSPTHLPLRTTTSRGRASSSLPTWTHHVRSRIRRLLQLKSQKYRKDTTHVTKTSSNFRECVCPVKLTPRKPSILVLKIAIQSNQAQHELEFSDVYCLDGFESSILNWVHKIDRKSGRVLIPSNENSFRQTVCAKITLCSRNPPIADRR